MSETPKSMSAGRERLIREAPGEEGGQASHAMHQAKQSAKQMGSQATEAISSVAQRAQERAQQAFTERKNSLADQVDSIAGLLRETGEQLEQKQGVAAGRTYANSAAQQVESVAQYLREHDVDELVDDVRRHARRHPAAFLGTLFVGGFLMARFLRASAERQQEEQRSYQRPTSYGSDTPSYMQGRGPGYTGSSGAGGATASGPGVMPRRGPGEAEPLPPGNPSNLSGPGAQAASERDPYKPGSAEKRRADEQSRNAAPPPGGISPIPPGTPGTSGIMGTPGTPGDPRSGPSITDVAGIPTEPDDESNEEQKRKPKPDVHRDKGKP